MHNKAIKTFWEEKHRTDDIAALSGCLYDDTIDFMVLNDYVSKGKKVLEVGPGLGYVTKVLYEEGAIVSVLDISSISLVRVLCYCEGSYNLEHLDAVPSDYFDVIICNNVVQHVTTELLIEELEVLVRSLTSEGVLAIEFVSNKGFEDNGVAPSIEEIKNGGLCRTPEYLEKLINNVGGKCELVFDREVDLGIVQGHHVFHVTKENL